MCRLDANVCPSCGYKCAGRAEAIAFVWQMKRWHRKQNHAGKAQKDATHNCNKGTQAANHMGAARAESREDYVLAHAANNFA